MPVLLVLLALVNLLPFGGLYVNTLPSGADVWIDGTYVGRTPLLVDGLRAGKHDMTVTKTGWRVEEVDQTIDAGVTTDATVQLVPVGPITQRGKLMLHGLDRRARVCIDQTPCLPLRSDYDLQSGAHRLVVREPEEKFKRAFAIYPGQTTHILFAPSSVDSHSAIVAPLTDYMPATSSRIEGNRLVIRWGGHTVVGHIGDARFVVDGRPIVYDAPAGFVRGRLYLPLRLLLAITGRSKAVR